MSDDVQVHLKDRSSPDIAAREAGHLQALRGPGIVALEGRDTDGGLLLQKAVCSLADVLHERGPLPDDEVRAVGAAASTALARVHEAGLVHGDVKPANLLLSPSGELLLADFDAAAPADGQRLARSSPPRSAPGAPARPAIDVRALAVTLVELSTGALVDACVPWRAQDLRQLGCPPALSAEISFLLGRLRSAPSAQSAARMFERGGCGTLPVPASTARHIDPTPTIEFMPARSQPDSSPRSDPAVDHPTRSWWQRLAASWRPSST